MITVTKVTILRGWLKNVQRILMRLVKEVTFFEMKGPFGPIKCEHMYKFGNYNMESSLSLSLSLSLSRVRGYESHEQNRQRDILKHGSIMRT
jgi:hypothetical protein